MPKTPCRVGLFVTCLVDLFRPRVGFATVRLLEQAGCAVSVPSSQTCCGQPAYNSGDFASTRAIARQVIDMFDGFDYVVAPSGSCVGMIRKHYPEIFEDDDAVAEAANRLADRTYELMAFLTDVRGMETVSAHYPRTVTYHDSCSGLRELGVKRQPRRLLASVSGLELKELPGAEICCGFGGTFCVKYPDVSTKIVDDKAADIEATNAETVLAGDLGCLMNIAGRLQRRGVRTEVRHVAEVLAGMGDGAPIGEAES